MRNTFGKSLTGFRIAGWQVLMLMLVLPLSNVTGCAQKESASEDSRATTFTPTAMRAERRAFDGAPPVIPHPPLGAACVACHTETGREAPPVGFAPPNPHRGTAVEGKTANCRQCHVFAQTEELFVASDFAGLLHDPQPAARPSPGAPPVVPHPVLMRENCLACHASPTARPEIRTTHPERVNCQQCHMSRASNTEFVLHQLP